MPKLWTETVEAHRAAVRDATLDAAAALVAEHGLGSLTMSRLATQTGVGRATLYKYFPDVEAVVLAWQERQINTHLAHLRDATDRIGEPGERVEAMCHTYANIQYRMRTARGGELASLPPRRAPASHAYQRLRAFVTQLLAEAASAGQVRDDVAPGELADFCLHALIAAASADSPETVGHLVRITLTGLRQGARQFSRQVPSPSPRPIPSHIPDQIPSCVTRPNAPEVTYLAAESRVRRRRG